MVRRALLLAACASAAPVPLQHSGGAALLSEDGIATMLDGEPITADRLLSLVPGTTATVERERIDLIDPHGPPLTVHVSGYTTAGTVMSVWDGTVFVFDPRVTTASGLRVGSTIEELHRVEPKLACGSFIDPFRCSGPTSRFSFHMVDGKVAWFELQLPIRPRAARKEWIAELGGLGPIDVRLAASAVRAALPAYTIHDRVEDSIRVLELSRDGALALTIYGDDERLRDLSIVTPDIPTRIGIRVGDTIATLRARVKDATCEPVLIVASGNDITQCHAGGLTFQTAEHAAKAPLDPDDKFVAISVPLR